MSAYAHHLARYVGMMGCAAGAAYVGEFGIAFAIAAYALHHAPRPEAQ